ncbi:MAG: tRNA (adenosine(37)-N6)-threonylcarbamoyltransferase complex ATPase subunit type 1 TsaE [Candidatus Taylorbacteria bacterium]|nr:tRNA (adenosine(37)-N6)-threonylcarbamoyltransferase complex ATPase subunit type 1 TsaE [Candidatus Taylorbacteria bacterium]
MHKARLCYAVFVQTKTHNLAEFQQAAQDFALSLMPIPDRATVVGLYGDLGAGKTTFTQAVAKALGVTETLNSPTFLIFKKYQLPHSLSPSSEGEIERGCFETLIHVDAYRLKDAAELARLRFDDLLADPHNLILIEWADKVTDVLPQNHIKLWFEFVDSTTRKIALG